MSSKKTQLKSLRLSTDLISKIEAIATQENRNFTNMAETLLIRQLERKDH